MARMVIGSEWVGSQSGSEIDVVDPATEEAFDSVPAAGPGDVDGAVREAQGAFASWSRTDPERRAEILRAGLKLVLQHADEIAQTLVHEQGKPSVEAAGELQHFLHGMTYYADLATKLRGVYQPLPSTLGSSYGLVIPRPVGVVAAVVPSNYPLTLMGTKIGPALVAGNTVVVKPAETTPLATLRIAGLLREAGLPEGVVNVVTGVGPEVGEALVGHPDVRRVAFTGSSATGRRVMEIAGPSFKRITLELGGSDPAIVCPDADLDKAAKNILIGRFWNAGQSCLAVKRVYAFAEIYDELLERLIVGTERYEPGEGWIKAEKPKIRMGPLHTSRQRDHVLRQLKSAVGSGGEVVYGGQVPDDRDRGHFLTPAIVTGAAHDSAVTQEEVFGPLLPVFRVGDLDEAIALSNASPYGLGSSVWTHDSRVIHRSAQEIEAGMTWVNQIHYGYDELPFGGVKQSGFGKEHGLEAIGYYTDDKSVVVGGLG